VSVQATILVVDDNDAGRFAKIAMLRRAGFSVLDASTGRDALDITRRQPIDLVLLDVNLPDMSGYTVCRELRAAYGERLPIVFVSGYRTESMDRAAGLLIGGDDYMVKPTDLDELLARVRRLIERAQERSSGASAGFGLTRRELEVLQLLGTGKRGSEIAVELQISPKTVSSHVQSLFRKLDVHSRAQAVARAYEHGLVV
jgi:DNA-binding NarL/FixJ family response regulator